MEYISYRYIILIKQQGFGSIGPLIQNYKKNKYFHQLVTS